MVTKKSIYNSKPQLQNKTKKRKIDKPQTYNYYSATEFYPDKYIEGLFSARGNWNRLTKAELKTTKKPIHFININGKYLLEKYYYGIKSSLKNIVTDGKKNATLKHNLIDYLATHTAGRKYIMESHTINVPNTLNGVNAVISRADKEPVQTVLKVKQLIKKSNQLLKYKHLFTDKYRQKIPKLYIFKPVSGFAGANIVMIRTYQELVKHINKISNKWSRGWQRGSNYYKEWVLQEYLADPLLFKEPKDNKEYKFHIRHYYIFRPGNKSSFFLKKGLMPTGLLPYKQDDWTNKDIHDTHFHGRDGEKFPEALGLEPHIIKNIYAQITELYTIIDELLKKHTSCYNETKYCFEIFGADLMITKDFNVKILELNDSPALAYDNRDYVLDELKSVMENVMTIIVDDYFPPAKPITNQYRDEVVFLE